VESEEQQVIVGEIIGYRAWFIHHPDKLGSISTFYRWIPGINEARNHAPRRTSQSYPHPLCFPKAVLTVSNTAGFYAFKSETDAVEIVSVSVTAKVVFGKIAMWGTVIEHRHGYRAEFARIISLDKTGAQDKSILDVLKKKYLIELDHFEE
jgi:hypothetical protein